MTNERVSVGSNTMDVGSTFVFKTVLADKLTSATFPIFNGFIT